ncbi:unnamed protein product [Caenorhabditis brenneri]
MANLEKPEEIKIAQAEYPKLMPLLNLDNMELYSTSQLFVQLTLIVMVLTFVVFCTLFLFYYFQILQMLHGHRKFMAARTYSKHLAAVLSLVAQLSVLIIWIAVPLALLIGDVIFHVEGVERFEEWFHVKKSEIHKLSPETIATFRSLFSPATTMVAPKKTLHS